jgi:hypothetical protein
MSVSWRDSVDSETQTLVDRTLQILAYKRSLASDHEKFVYTITVKRFLDSFGITGFSQETELKKFKNNPGEDLGVILNYSTIDSVLKRYADTAKKFQYNSTERVEIDIYALCFLRGMAISDEHADWRDAFYKIYENYKLESISTLA